MSRATLAERERAERLSFARSYALDPSVVAPCAADADGALGSTLYAHQLADHECAHGRLPGDRTDPCGCWMGEPGYTGPPAPTVSEVETPEPDPELTVSPFTQRLLDETDAEIERLRAFRASLLANPDRPSRKGT